MSKICSRCLLEKEISDFGARKKSKDGLHGVCKICRNSDTKKWRMKKVYTEEEIKLQKDISRKYYVDNKVDILRKSKEFRDKNKDYVRNYKKKYYAENREELIKYSYEYHSSRIKNDYLYKFKCNVRTLIKNSLKYRGGCKVNTKTSNALGCSIEIFRIYIESKFEPWMNWDNYGLFNGKLNYGWDIDHIIPISIANTEEEIIKLNHFSNLQPMCSYLNRCVKRDKII